MTVKRNNNLARFMIVCGLVAPNLQDVRDQIDNNFGVRHYIGWVMFFLISLTPYLLPRLDRKISVANN
jgi:hypothetical protein